MDLAALFEAERGMGGSLERFIYPRTFLDCEQGRYVAWLCRRNLRFVNRAFEVMLRMRPRGWPASRRARSLPECLVADDTRRPAATLYHQPARAREDDQDRVCGPRVARGVNRL